MKVIPVADRAVRDPKNMQLLPEDGREVDDGDPFWLRRVRDGDVTVEGGEQPEQQPEATAQEQQSHPHRRHGSHEHKES